MIENTDSEHLEINSDKTRFSDNIKDKNSEENLVKDLNESLSESVDESINILNSLIREIQEKIKDESVNDETKTLVNLLSEKILNLTDRNIYEIGINENLDQSNFEEE